MRQAVGPVGTARVVEEATPTRRGTRILPARTAISSSHGRPAPPPRPRRARRVRGRPGRPAGAARPAPSGTDRAGSRQPGHRRAHRSYLANAPRVTRTSRAASLRRPGSRAPARASGRRSVHVRGLVLVEVRSWRGAASTTWRLGPGVDARPATRGTVLGRARRGHRAAQSSPGPGDEASTSPAESSDLVEGSSAWEALRRSASRWRTVGSASRRSGPARRSPSAASSATGRSATRVSRTRSRSHRRRTAAVAQPTAERG